MAVLTAACGVWAFISLADEIVERETHAFDRAVLLAFRNASPPHAPLGPVWFQEFCRDVTALGGIGILVLAVLAVTVFLMLAKRQRTALFTFVATSGGMVLSQILKALFDRPRPDLVPHAVEVATSSFPSGHAMMTAVVYLTLGALLARLLPQRRLKVYIMAVAMALSAMVGLSRIYLGVHWPTDVLAGWAVGAAWAALCWLVARRSIPSHGRFVWDGVSGADGGTGA